jgi:hypothetical protein
LSEKFPEGTYILSRRERDKNVEVRATDKLRRGSIQLCAGTLQGGQEVEKPFEVS